MTLTFKSGMQSFLRNGVRLDTADRMTFMELWGALARSACVTLVAALFVNPCVFVFLRLRFGTHTKMEQEGWSIMCDMSASERLYLR